MIVEGIINLSKNLGFETIAEGVEVEKQRELLEEIGCELGQGYLVSKPMQLKEIFQKKV